MERLPAGRRDPCKMQLPFFLDCGYGFPEIPVLDRAVLGREEPVLLPVGEPDLGAPDDVAAVRVNNGRAIRLYGVKGPNHGKKFAPVAGAE